MDVYFFGIIFGYNLEKLCAKEILAVIYNCRHLILDFIR